MKFSKLSTGNQIEGKILEIRKGAVTAIVYVAIAGDTTLQSSVTIATLDSSRPMVLPSLKQFAAASVRRKRRQ